MNTKPDTCPACDASIARTNLCEGMWDGCKSNGAKAGGGILKTACSACGTQLVAYIDLYDDNGKLQGSNTELPLHWEPDSKS